MQTCISKNASFLLNASMSKTFFENLLESKNLSNDVLYNVAIQLLHGYIIKIHPHLKSTRVQNPPVFFIFSLFLNLFFNFFYFFLLIFYLFFTITVTPNRYPRSVSGFRIWLGGFWTRVDFQRVPIFLSYINRN